MKVINDVGKKTILLVDDEDYLVDILKKLLVWQGYYVLTVKNGLEAVEAYKAKTEKIDIILMDIIMPKMSGVEALVKIKDYDPYVPIILMSGFAEESVEGLPHVKRQGYFPVPAPSLFASLAINGLPVSS